MRLLSPSTALNKRHTIEQYGLKLWCVQAGALVAGVVFALTSDKGKFYISAACGLAGVVCTFLFIPDITGLDLREGDRRWLKSLEKGMHTATLPPFAQEECLHCRLYTATLPALLMREVSTDWNTFKSSPCFAHYLTCSLLHMDVVTNGHQQLWRAMQFYMFHELNCGVLCVFATHELCRRYVVTQALFATSCMDGCS